MINSDLIVMNSEYNKKRYLQSEQDVLNRLNSRLLDNRVKKAYIQVMHLMKDHFLEKTNYQYVLYLIKHTGHLWCAYPKHEYISRSTPWVDFTFYGDNQYHVNWGLSIRNEYRSFVLNIGVVNIYQELDVTIKNMDNILSTFAPVALLRKIATTPSLANAKTDRDYKQALLEFGVKVC